MPEARSPSEKRAPDTSHVIAIDGPVASGKTVVGRELAKRLGWAMLDTGIMYRALTLVRARTGASTSAITCG